PEYLRDDEAPKPSGSQEAQSLSAQSVPLTRATTSRNRRQTRRARSRSCSRRMRRVFCFWAASRKRMAAQVTTRKRLRLSRWMMMGMETAPTATARALQGEKKRKAKGCIARSTWGAGITARRVAPGPTATRPFLYREGLSKGRRDRILEFHVRKGCL